MRSENNNYQHTSVGAFAGFMGTFSNIAAKLDELNLGIGTNNTNAMLVRDLETDIGFFGNLPSKFARFTRISGPTYSGMAYGAAIGAGFGLLASFAKNLHNNTQGWEFAQNLLVDTLTASAIGAAGGMVPSFIISNNRSAIRQLASIGLGMGASTGLGYLVDSNTSSGSAVA